MPELPEVETVARSLDSSLKGKVIKGVDLIWEPILDNTTLKRFRDVVLDNTIKGVTRRAKYIFILVGDFIVAYHLRMTGRVYISDKGPKPKHMHASIALNGNKEIRFEDVRKFSRIYLIRDEGDLSQRLGIEPLSKEFTKEWLAGALSNRNKRIKHLLFEQSFIAGLGNIYIDEILWSCRIHPNKISSEISRVKTNRLRESIVSTLTNSIQHHGTTFRDFVFEGFRVGDYSSELKVFGKEGKMCPRCTGVIRKIKVVSRGTHYCPKCQRL